MHESDMIKVRIDGDEIEVEEGTTILNAARKLGKHVPPAMCYYTRLHGTGGKCRVCLVKVSKGSRKGSAANAQTGCLMQHTLPGWHGNTE